MNKRTFIQRIGIAGLSAGELIRNISGTKAVTDAGKNKAAHWVWTRPNPADSDQELEKLYRSYYEAGIKGIFFEADGERHYRLAKKHKLEAHRWMWIMNRGEKELLSSHPEWYAVSRSGK